MTEEPLDDSVWYVISVEFMKETFMRYAVKGFGEIKENEKGYSPALNGFEKWVNIAIFPWRKEGAARKGWIDDSCVIYKDKGEDNLSIDFYMMKNGHLGRSG